MAKKKNSKLQSEFSQFKGKQQSLQQEITDLRRQHSMKEAQFQKEIKDMKAQMSKAEEGTELTLALQRKQKDFQKENDELKEQSTAIYLIWKTFCC
jgi:predicted  nucleic acid-binding Zn-ribbon protein